MNPYPDHFVISYHNDLWFYDDSCCDFTMVTMITLWSRALPPAAIFTAPIKLGVIAHPQPLRPRFLPLGVFVHHLVGDGSHRVDHRWIWGNALPEVDCHPPRRRDRCHQSRCLPPKCLLFLVPDCPYPPTHQVLLGITLKVASEVGLCPHHCPHHGGWYHPTGKNCWPYCSWRLWSTAGEAL